MAEAEGHHPDIELGWGRASFDLTTHAASGLTRNDFVMAAKIDRLRSRRRSGEPRGGDARPHQGGHRAPQRDLPDARARDPAEHRQLRAVRLGRDVRAAGRAARRHPAEALPGRLPGLRLRDRGGDRRGGRRAARRAGAGVAGAAAKTTSRFRFSGSRPSASSFSRCASSVSRAAGRSAGGRVVPHLVEQLVVRAQAARERVEQPVLAVEAVRDVLVELRGRVPHDRAVARAQRIERRARAAAAATPGRAASEPPPGGMKTLPSPSTVSPQKSDAIGEERDVVERVARRRDHLERAERVTVVQHDVRRQALRGRLLEPSGSGLPGRPRPALRSARATPAPPPRGRGARA